MLRFIVKIFERNKMHFLCKMHVNVVKISMMFDLFFNARYSLILNVWTNKHHQFFLNVNVYYIDKHWNFQKILLNFKSLLNEHTNEKMIKIVSTLLMKYFIEHRLMTITIDNVSFNEILRRCLIQNLKTHHDIEWNYQKKYVRCMTHVIQLMFDAIFRILKMNSNTKTTKNQRFNIQIYDVNFVISYFNIIKKIINYHFELSFQIIISN